MSGFDIGFTPDPTAARRARLATGLRADIDRLGQEAVTGRATDETRALSGRTREAQGLAARREALDAFGRASTLAAGRAGVQQEALGTIRAAVETMANEAVTVVAGATAPALATLNPAAEAALDTVVSALSARFGPVSVFAGDATDRGALADADTILANAKAAAEDAGGGETGDAALRAVFDDPDGLFATTHYTGGDGPAPGVAIDEDTVVAGDLTAEDAVFRGVLRDLAAIAAATDPAASLEPETRRALVAAAAERLRGLLDPLAEAAARLGVVEARIETTRTAQAAEAAALSLALDAMTERDPFEAATHLAATEDALEILFATTARLSALSLASYLR